MSHRSFALTAALVAVVAALSVALLAPQVATGQNQSSAPKARRTFREYGPTIR